MSSLISENIDSHCPKDVDQEKNVDSSQQIWFVFYQVLGVFSPLDQNNFKYYFAYTILFETTLSWHNGVLWE